MDNDKQTKKELFKATGIVGGAQVFIIVLGVVRTKIVAVLLGPEGIGILGILQSIVDMVRNATSFGINFSGVKDVAQANETGDGQRIARTITVLRRWAVLTGLLGMIVTIVLCVPLSRFSFDSPAYALSIAVLSISLLITSISAGQIALLQGLRRIGQMAKASLWGAVVGTAVVVPIYWVFGIRGIVPAILLTAAGTLLISWLYARKIKIDKPKITLRQTLREGLGMAKLGFFIVITGFVSLATMYLVRIIIMDRAGIDSVGLFQAVWTVTNVYMGIILNAMLADFFPRLSAVSADNQAVRKLVNQQLELALLVGGILVVAMMAGANIALALLYSHKFDGAATILQWQMLGALMVFITWPLGVIFLAKGKGKLIIFSDALWCAVYILTVYFCWKRFGFDILGIAYVAGIFSKLAVEYFICRKMIDYRFSKVNLKYIVLFGTGAIAILIAQQTASGIAKHLISFSIMAALTAYALVKLNEIVGFRNILKRFTRRS